jgi:SAM-dependent methyltransferase
VILHYGASQSVTWNEPRTEYEDVYLDKYYKYDDGDGRLYWRNSLTAAGTRQGSSGLPWRDIDVAATGQHWKFTREHLDELDAEGRIYWPPGGGFPQIKRYREDLKGVAVGDIWTDIDRINQVAAERLGYPTQKPLALLERIIAASSNEGDVVLDPFCGCGTTIDAAEKLHRRWIGIDVTYLAIDLIRKRLRHTYGDPIEATYVVHGVPADLDGARALFAENPFDFERWAVSLIDAQPNEKQVGDRGIDGRVRFFADKDHIGQILVSVKGGATVNPGMVRDLRGTVEREGAEMGVLIALTEPTRGIREEVDKSGSYTSPLTGQEYPRIQVVTVADLMDKRMPKMPAAILPYLKAKPRDPDQLTFGTG